MNEFTPRVSVVVGAYNGAETVAACLESLLNQNYPRKAYDVIVVENGSTDGTGEVIKRFPVRLYHRQERGIPGARNLGIAESQADIIATTDCDCVAHPDWLAELVKPYRSPEVGGVGGAILAYRAKKRNIVETFSDRYPPFRNLISGDNEFLPRIYGGNASFRRGLLNQVGGYNERLLMAEDVDVSWRIQLETRTELRYAPKAIIYHRHHVTRRGLARQYRGYGFGEILLDTLYGGCPGYPRPRAFQKKRILGQMAVLPRYILSMVYRTLLLALGKMSLSEAAEPYLWFLIESNNIRGKVEALRATRFMTEGRSVFQEKRDEFINRFYGHR